MADEFHDTTSPVLYVPTLPVSEIPLDPVTVTVIVRWGFAYFLDFLLLPAGGEDYVVSDVEFVRKWAFQHIIRKLLPTLSSPMSLFESFVHVPLLFHDAQFPNRFLFDCQSPLAKEPAITMLFPSPFSCSTCPLFGFVLQCFARVVSTSSSLWEATIGKLFKTNSWNIPGLDGSSADQASHIGELFLRANFFFNAEGARELMFKPLRQISLQLRADSTDENEIAAEVVRRIAAVFSSGGVGDLFMTTLSNTALKATMEVPRLIFQLPESMEDRLGPGIEGRILGGCFPSLREVPAVIERLPRFLIVQVVEDVTLSSHDLYLCKDVLLGKQELKNPGDAYQLFGVVMMDLTWIREFQDAEGSLACNDSWLRYRLESQSSDGSPSIKVEQFCAMDFRRRVLGSEKLSPKLLFYRSRGDSTTVDGFSDLPTYVEHFFVERKRFCGSCGSRDAELKQCSRCHQCWYCSVNCQRVHWKEVHRGQCKPCSREIADDILRFRALNEWRDIDERLRKRYQELSAAVSSDLVLQELLEEEECKSSESTSPQAKQLGGRRRRRKKKRRKFDRATSRQKSHEEEEESEKEGEQNQSELESDCDQESRQYVMKKRRLVREEAIESETRTKKPSDRSSRNVLSRPSSEVDTGAVDCTGGPNSDSILEAHSKCSFEASPEVAVGEDDSSPIPLPQTEPPLPGDFVVPEDEISDAPIPECVVCMDAKRCILFQPCNHLMCCHTCSENLEFCPVCRGRTAVL